MKPEFDTSGLTKQKSVSDPETGQVLVIDELMKSTLLALEKFIGDAKKIEALVLHVIRSKKLYLCVEGVQTWDEYIATGRLRIGRSQVFNYLKLADRFGPFLPDLEVQNMDFYRSGIQPQDISQLPVRFGECPPEKQMALDIFDKTPVSNLIELANHDDIDLAPIQYGAGITMPSGEIVMTKDLHTFRVAEFREMLKPVLATRPDAVTRSFSVQHQDSGDIGVMRQKLAAWDRFRREMLSELKDVSLTEDQYSQIEADIRVFRHGLEQLPASFSKENLVNKAVPEIVTFEYYSAVEIADKVGVSERAIQKLIKQKKIDARFIEGKQSAGRGGVATRIRPEGLPEELRRKFVEGSTTQDPARFEAETDVWSMATKSQRDRIKPYYHAIKNMAGLKGHELKVALDRHNLSLPAGSRINLKTFYRKLKLYEEGGLLALLPDHGKNAGLTVVNEEDFKYFASLFLTQNRLSQKECHRQVFGRAAIDGRAKVIKGKLYEIDPQTGKELRTYPSASSFHRLLTKRYSKDEVYLARYGEHKLRQTGLSYSIDRDLTTVRAGDVWVSDHRQIDILANSSKKVIGDLAKKVLHAKLSDIDRNLLTKRIRRAIAAQFSGKPVRLWLTAWIDFKTGKWLSWLLHEEDPNSDHIIQSFKWAVQKYGIPKGVYLDNGKDYRCKDFAGNPRGKKLDEQEMTTLLGQLDVKVTFSIVKNARAKIIERQFRHFIEKFEKHFGTYTGKNSSDRPETTHANIKRGEIPDALDVIDLFEQFITALNSQPREGKELRGLSPDALFSKEFNEKRTISERALAMFTMRTSAVRSLQANGFKDPDIDHFYYASWMATMAGRKVYLRRDPEQWQTALVFDAKDHDELGTAELIAGTPGWAQTDEEHQQVENALAIQKQRGALLKASLKDLRKIAVGDTVDNYRSLVAIENEIMLATHDVTGDNEAPINRMTRTGLDDIMSRIETAANPTSPDLSSITPDTSKPGKKLKGLLSDPDED